MKKIIFAVCLLLITSVSAAEQSTNDEQVFKAWCDAFTAQSMVSLAANRIFGHISELSDEDYEARRDWVNENYGLAEKRFTAVTGEDFQTTDGYAIELGWVQQCQLKDVIQ